MCVHSVVAITGLGGHAFGSWLGRTTTKRPIDRPMWLRDFLPQRFPNARIMTYGYDSSLKESNVANFNITDYRRGFIQCLRNSRRQCPVSLRLTRIALRIFLPFLCAIKGRPIILIGHGLGGILVVQVGGLNPCTIATAGYKSNNAQIILI